MIQILENIDQDLLLFFNGANFKCLDSLMFFISSKLFWIPVIFYGVFMFVKKFKKKFWIPLLACVFCFIITDQSSHIIKENVKRYRPTHNTELAQDVHVVNNYRGGQFGFFSGHASNSFGFAFLSLCFIKRKSYSYILLVWAILVSYSRIYLGVHYPSDVFVGFVFGVFIAYVLWKLLILIPYNRKLFVE